MKKKYDWKNMEYRDYPFINLLGKQSQLKKYIRGRTEKMDDIDKQIEKLKNIIGAESLRYEFLHAPEIRF